MSKIQNVFLLIFSFVFISFTTVNFYNKETYIKDFTLKSSTDNKKISLSDYKDAKGFVVIFTCNKCPMAKFYSERMNKIYDKYKKQNIYLLAVNSMDTVAYAEESFKLMQQKAKKAGFHFPYLQDKKQSVAKQFKATHTPQAFILWKTPEGLAVKYKGAIDDNAGEADKATPLLTNSLDELLAGKPVSNPVTESFGCRIYIRGSKEKM